MTTTATIEVRALQPVVGSYPCPISECDFINDVFTENADGIVIKQKQPRKRYFGRISVTRRLSVHEIEAALRNELPANIEPIDPEWRRGVKPGAQTMPEVIAVFHAETFMLPVEIAKDLVSRGLVEIVSKPSTKRAA